MSLLLMSRGLWRPATSGGGGGGAVPFFADNFSGGVLGAPMQNGAIADTFTYYFNGGDPQVSSDRAVNGGTHSLKLSYGPNPPGTDSSCEVRFRLGRKVTQLWVEYWLWVPANFYMRETMNNKFFALWRDWTNNGNGNWTYSGYGPGIQTTQQFTLEYWGLGGPGPTATTRIACRQDPNSPGSDAFFYVTDMPYASNQTTMISADGPMIPGQWNRVRMRLKASSANGVSDGAFDMWLNDVHKHHFTNADVWNPAYTWDGSALVPQDRPSDIVFDCGYFMGYANTGFDEQTDFYIGDIKFYDVNPGWS